MSDSVFAYLPLVGLALAAYNLLIAARDAWREGRLSTTWKTTKGRVLEIQKHSEEMGEVTDGRLRSYYVLKCTYRTEDGRELSGWADRRYYRLIGHEGAVLPLWYDPIDPLKFTVQPPPRSTFRSMMSALPMMLVYVVFGAACLAMFYAKGL